MPALPKQLDTKPIFGPGFQYETQDAEFSWAFHDLTQVEGRFLGRGARSPSTARS